MKHLLSAAGTTIALASLLSAPAFAVTITLAPVDPAQPPTIVNTRTCAVPNADATLDFALYHEPTIAMQQGAAGTAVVRIAVNKQGTLTDAALTQSSGNVWIDRSAVETAFTSTFHPRIAGCEKVASAYLFAVQY